MFPDIGFFVGFWGLFTVLVFGVGVVLAGLLAVGAAVWESQSYSGLTPTQRLREWAERTWFLVLLFAVACLVSHALTKKLYERQTVKNWEECQWQMQVQAAQCDRYMRRLEKLGYELNAKQKLDRILR